MAIMNLNKTKLTGSSRNVEYQIIISLQVRQTANSFIGNEYDVSHNIVEFIHITCCFLNPHF